MTGKAILITPSDVLTCHLVNFPDGDSHLHWMYQQIDCTCVTVINPMPGSLLSFCGDNIDLWGDDEGLLRPVAYHNRTTNVITGYPSPLVGNWLLTEHDNEGNTLPLAKQTIKNITKILSPIRGGMTVR